MGCFTNAKTQTAAWLTHGMNATNSQPQSQKELKPAFLMRFRLTKTTKVIDPTNNTMNADNPSQTDGGGLPVSNLDNTKPRTSKLKGTAASGAAHITPSIGFNRALTKMRYKGKACRVKYNISNFAVNTLVLAFV